MKAHALSLAILMAGPLAAQSAARPWEETLNALLERSLLSSTPAVAPDFEKPSRPPAATPVVPQFATPFESGLESGRGGIWQSSLERLAIHRPLIARILREERLPERLMWIGLVESGFNPLARSPKGALGIWQLMPATATAFGLKVGAPEERTDPEKSTRAAARYLKFLYARFGDWPLALAAYNAGDGRVSAALAKSGQRSVWSLIEGGWLPAETQAYVPAVLAAQKLADLGETEEPTDEQQRYRPAKVVFAPVTFSRAGELQ